MSWTTSPLWTALACSGLGGLVALALTKDQLAEGGLVMVATCAVVAIAVGLPVALAERRVQPDPLSGLSQARSALVDVWLAIAVAAAIATVWPLTSWALLAAVVIGWATVAASGRPGRAMGGIATLIAVVLCLITTISTPWVGPGFTLMDAPRTLHLATVFGLQIPWIPWLGFAMVCGYLLSGAGLSRSSSLGPTSAAVITRIGTGLLLLLGAALCVAGAYEWGPEAAWRYPLAIPLVLILPIALLGGLTLQTPSPRLHLATIGCVATLLFMGPAHDALPMWWTGILPLGLGASLLIQAIRSSGAQRVTLIVGAVVVAWVPLMAWPDLPGPLAAALLALAPVAAIWSAGTRTLTRKAA
ncbi:MAG: hypothetical protein AB8H79_24275 [Myxococcota bacterium]